MLSLVLVEGPHQKVIQERLGTGEPAQLGLVNLVESSLAALVVQGPVEA
jgi:hypothetical protein